MREPDSLAENLVLTLRFDSFFTFGRKKFQWKQIVAELAGIFVEYSFKFISRLKAYDKISKKIDIWRKAYDCVLRLTSFHRKTKKCSHLI